MSGKRRKKLEAAFRALHQGRGAPKTAWEPRDDTGMAPGYLRSMHRGMKKRPRDFGIGVEDGGLLTQIKVGTMRSLHLREPLPADEQGERP